MTLPEGVQPSGPTEPAPDSVISEPAVAPEPVAETPVEVTPAEEIETPEEAASDAALRAWAKDNGLDGVPASGRLSSAWREQITAAMAAALDPKDEASAELTQSESSTSVETTTEETTTPEVFGGGFLKASTSPVVVAGDGSYYDPATGRTIWQAPNTFVTGQAFTA